MANLIIIPNLIPPNNSPGLPQGPLIIILGARGTIPDHSGRKPKNRLGPTRIPKYFGPFWTRWDQTNPITNSAQQFPARGCPQNPIWSHGKPNQAGDPVFGRSARGFCRLTRKFFEILKSWDCGNLRIPKIVEI